jgi:lipoprotein NlpD
MKNALMIVLCAALGGCVSQSPAPVSERGQPATRTKTAAISPGMDTAPSRPGARQIIASENGLHIVQKGDTLHGIAFANNVDFQDLAVWNNLESVNVIKVGQVLRLSPPDGAVAAGKGVEIQPLKTESRREAKPLQETPLLREPQAVLLPYSQANWAKATAPTASRALSPPVIVPGNPTPSVVIPTPPVAAPVVPPTGVTTPQPTSAPEGWLWPAKGQLKGRFGEGGGKGIDIVGERNTPVIAVAPGRVVYSGSGLRGYGRLLIIKHPGEFLSAYAHNQDMLVKEGDTVNAGQKIALMGDSDADRVKLHFEIRQYGRPLDPLKYLPNPP